ncbi:sortase domain-bontaining protein [Streptomyces albidoflavus]|uniref:sortase domain-containing protein n=1 Tax=Streptomyces sp. T7(2022) TaxID=2916034 RepID=UPI001EE47CBE|nr:sortase [Streptomyces sp. T7(2022)]MCG5117313.1 class F sortase [Streptomyces sp. T7(2022)]
MPEPRPFDRLGPPSWPAPWGILALLLLAGLALIRNGSGEFDSGPPQPAPAAATGARSPAALPGTAGAVPAALPASPAVRVRVPGAGVDAPVRPVGLDDAGWIDPPPARAPHPAGWFTGSPAPGARGTSVLAGLVDGAEGPAVFHGLGAVEKGGRVEVARADGRAAVSTVYGVDVVPKRGFPARRV